MLVTIFEELEFEANLSFQAGDPGNLNGLPENCWPATPDEAEFISYGPFHTMFDAVYTACWICNLPMSEEAMYQIADEVEFQTITEFLKSPSE